MKKHIVISIIIGVLILIAVICGIFLIHENKESNNPILPSEGLEFTLNDYGESYSVTGIGTCTDSDIVIPSEYDGKPVTNISNLAFAEYDNEELQPLPAVITSVTIPASVTSIGNGAFWSCTILKSVVFEGGSQLRSIDKGAFLHCEALESITLPNSVTSIGDYAFQNCISLSNITISSATISFGEGAFSYCRSLVRIYYGGTMEQWKAITKGNAWNMYTNNYTINCTDGTMR